MNFNFSEPQIENFSVANSEDERGTAEERPFFLENSYSLGDRTRVWVGQQPGKNRACLAAGPCGTDSEARRGWREENKNTGTLRKDTPLADRFAQIKQKTWSQWFVTWAAAPWEPR